MTNIAKSKFEYDEKIAETFLQNRGDVLSAFSGHMLRCIWHPVMKSGQWAATTKFKIDLTTPVTKGVVDAYAEIINRGRTQAVVQIKFVNEGWLAAVAQGTVTIRGLLW